MVQIKKVLSVVALLLPIVYVSPAAQAATVTWGSCVTNKGGFAVDVYLYPTNAMTPSWNGKSMTLPWSPVPVATYTKTGLLLGESYCIQDGGTYYAVLIMEGAKLANFLVGAALAAAVAVPGAAVCVATGGVACPAVVAGVATVAGGSAGLLPPATSLIGMEKLAPRNSIVLTGVAEAPKMTSATTFNGIICNRWYPNFACVVGSSYKASADGTCQVGALMTNCVGN